MILFFFGLSSYIFLKKLQNDTFFSFTNVTL
jgi:hypothetical protein